MLGANLGCSMCIAMNGDQLEPGQYAVFNRNRNSKVARARGGALPRPARLDCRRCALTQKLPTRALSYN